MHAHVVQPPASNVRVELSHQQDSIDKRDFPHPSSLMYVSHLCIADLVQGSKSNEKQWVTSLAFLSQEKNIKHTGNLSLDDIVEIARVMRDRSCARQLKGTVKEILGTCKSVGCTVDHEDPVDIQNKARFWRRLRTLTFGNRCKAFPGGGAPAAGQGALLCNM